MNKFHVVLLSILAPMVLNAEISAETKNKLIVLGTDGAIYNYAPDVVGGVKGAGNFITPACIKNRLHVPAFITNITNKLPNAVNAENANRVLTAGIVEALLDRCGSDDLKGDAKLPIKYICVAHGVDHIKHSAKFAVNSMKDATVAIAAVEVLSWAGNKLGGERAEQIATNYASWINRAKTVGYAVAKQLSQAYTYEVFTPAVTNS